MSDAAAESFRRRIAEDAVLRDRIRTACVHQGDLDLAAIGRELGFAVTRMHLLRLWAELAFRGELNDFEIELHTKIKHYPNPRGFAWMNHELAKNMTSAPPIEVTVDPDAAAVGVITAPRKPATLDTTLASLRSGGFSQEIHVFAEPKTLRAGWSFPSTRLHQNPQRLGLYPNWLNAARWLLTHTDKPWILLCEDDVEFSLCAAAALWHGLTTLEKVGYISLYTSVRSVELAEAPLHPGWAPINLGRLNWGALAYGFPREVLTEIVRRETDPEQESTDSHVAEHLRQLGLNCWHHLPSLARHTGDQNSSVGHPGRTGYATIGYDPSYFGFRDVHPRSAATSAARLPASGTARGVPQFPAELPGELWGLIAHYNPARYTNKIQNLATCARRSRSQGLKLLIVELAFGEEPFEVPEDLADCIVRRRTTSVLWQKERLLNIGLRQLPASCDKVVWLDGDVLFENEAWVHDTCRLLQSYVAVQPFETACWLAAGVEWLPAEAFEFGSAEGRGIPGMAYVMAGLNDPRDLLPDYHCQGHTGFAWAARRSLIEKHGFPDVQILGGGDFTMAQAMYGIEDFFDGSRGQCNRHCPAIREHIVQWSRRFHQDVRGSVYYVPGRALHLWHGNLSDRRYVERPHILGDHGFDPKTDLALDQAECWMWATDKPALHEQVAKYFIDRREGSRNLPAGPAGSHGDSTRAEALG